MFMGLKIMTKSKNRQFFHENHELGKVVEMKGTNGSFFLVGFSRTWNRKVKELEWEMRRIERRGLDGLKNRSGKCEGSGEGGR